MKMKRNLIALAIASAASAAMVTPAMADTTVFGRVQVELASVSFQTENPTPGVCDTTNTTKVTNGCDGLLTVDNSQGLVGVKSTEDLGNGWTGIAHLEYKVDTADGNAGGATTVGLTPRETWVGLKGAGVQIEAGRLKSAYKYAGGVKYDAFVATTLEARGNGGMSGTDYGQGGFLSNMVAVQGGSGPIMGRLTYSPDDGNHAYTLSVMYHQDNIEAFAAIADRGDQLDNGGAAGQSYTATKIGGSFSTGPHKIMLQYEMVDADDDRDQTYAYLAYNMKMGMNTFVVQYGQYTSDDPVDPTSDATYAVLGVNHAFSKTMRVFGGLRKTDVDDDSGEDVISVGLRKDF